MSLSMGSRTICLLTPTLAFIERTASFLANRVTLSTQEMSLEREFQCPLQAQTGFGGAMISGS